MRLVGICNRIGGMHVTALWGMSSEGPFCFRFFHGICNGPPRRAGGMLCLRHKTLFAEEEECPCTLTSRT